MKMEGDSYVSITERPEVCFIPAMLSDFLEVREGRGRRCLHRSAVAILRGKSMKCEKVRVEGTWREGRKGIR